MNQPITLKLLTSCILTLAMATSTVALAEYSPPPDQQPPGGYTQSTGPRGGCELTEKSSLIALAPRKHVGQTVAIHPTFAWFVSDLKSFPVEFTLYNYDPVKGLKLAYKTHLKSSPGIMKLSLPKDRPGLTVGQRYLWQVAILCDPNHPSSDLVAKAEIAVVQMPLVIKTVLSQVSDRQQKIELYAKSGLWYDALGEALADSSLKQVASGLLEDLAKLEASEVTQVKSTPTKLLGI